LKAARKYKVKSILLGGGVAANSCLRQKLKSSLQATSYKLQANLYIPPIKYCTDNAAVIGAAGVYKLVAGKATTCYNKIKADSNLKLK
ncbi:unnamed protein product, partial [marine sediment metagenome]